MQSDDGNHEISDEQDREGWYFEEGVTCVVAPCCGFTFDAHHTDAAGGRYSCPSCQVISLERRVGAETDRERLTALLQAFGVTSVNDKTDVVLYAKDPGVEGYTGFHTRFEFDADGKFVTVGVWE